MNQENKKLVIFDFNGVLNRGDLNDTVETLSSKYLMTVVSSSPDKYIINYLESEGMKEYFSEIFGSDVHKSKVIKINKILEKYNVSPKDAVFITDSLYDILDGNGCGVKSIGVTWGLHDKKELEKGNPVVTIDDSKDLLNAIQNVLK
jgi:phosphoglycolate phosphatase